MLLIEQQIHLCLNHGNSYLVKSSASKREELSSFSRRQNHCCKLAEGSLLQTFETLLAKYGKKKSNNLIGVLHNKVADPQGGWGGVDPVIPTWFNQMIFFPFIKAYYILAPLTVSADLKLQFWGVPSNGLLVSARKVVMPDRRSQLLVSQIAFRN